MSHLYANREVPHIGDTVRRIANYDYGGINPGDQAVVTNIHTVTSTYLILELNGVSYYNHVPHNYKLVALGEEASDFDGPYSFRLEPVAKRKKQKPKGGFSKFIQRIENA